MGKCYFNEDWYKNAHYKDWLLCDPNGDKSKFRCRTCNQSYIIGSSGIKALESHRKSSKHQKNASAQKGTSSVLNQLFSRSKSTTNSTNIQKSVQQSNSVSATSSSTSTTDNSAIFTSFTSTSDSSSSGQKRDFSRFVSDIETLKAELKWTMHVISSHSSARSSDGVDRLFASMFHDSRIAATFKCARTKLGYLSTYGIAPAILDELWKAVADASHVVIMFDESLNSDLQKKQMDIHLKFMDVDGTVKSRYITSYFLGKSRASDILDKLSDVLQRIGAEKLIQLSMDGPNVNWSVFRQLKEEVESKSPSHHSLLNIGCCGIHTTHNSFKSGVVESSWGLCDLLRFSFFLFNESPARREEFFKITNSSKLPLPFSGTRWLENGPAAQRLIDIWPSMCIYLKAIHEKKVSVPTCKSYSVVASYENDKLLIAKLHSFIFVANILKPFLTYFQRDEPLSPFIYSMLFDICVRLYGLIAKPKFCDSFNSDTDQMISPKRVEEGCWLSEDKFNIGFQAGQIVKQFESAKHPPVSKLQLKHFRQGFFKFVKAVLQKLIDKSPLNYPLSKSLTCVDPLIMKKHEKANALFSSLTELLSSSKLIEPGSVDGLRADYSELIRSLECSFNKGSDRLDHFFRDCTRLCQYPALQNVINIVLTLSHGNSDVERGFSVNKEVTVENLYEESLVARRLICQYVVEHDPADLVPSKNMISYARQAHNAYTAALEKKKEQKLEAEKSSTRKKKSEELTDLLSKKRKLELDIETLRREADKMVEKAEDAPAKLQHELVVKSNALRKDSRDKESKLSVLSSQITERQDELNAI